MNLEQKIKVDLAIDILDGKKVKDFVSVRHILQNPDMMLTQGSIKAIGLAVFEIYESLEKLKAEDTNKTCSPNYNEVVYALKKMLEAYDVGQRAGITSAIHVGRTVMDRIKDNE